MKILSVHDSNEEDSLQLVFEGVFASQKGIKLGLEPFFRALEENADQWMPNVIEGKRRRKYSSDAVWKSVEESRDDDSISLGLYRTQWPAVDMSLWLSLPPLPSKMTVLLEIKPLSLFADKGQCRRFVDMISAWASRYPVPRASAHSVGDSGLVHAPHLDRDEERARRQDRLAHVTPEDAALVAGAEHGGSSYRLST